jgi:hypothetical protein
VSVQLGRAGTYAHTASASAGGAGRLRPERPGRASLRRPTATTGHWEARDLRVDATDDAYVFGKADVTMANENGDVFARVKLEPIVDDAWLMLERGDAWATVTATAVEDHLDGSSCTRTIAKRVNAVTRIYAPSSCYDQRVRPARIIVACGDGNLQLRALTWRRWGAPVARAFGAALANDCLPYCAKGHFHRMPVHVRLSGLRRCSNIGRYVYTLLQLRIGGRLPRGITRRRASVPFPCRLYDLG